MKLLDAERSAQAHTNVLKVIKKELDHIKLVKTMSTNPMNLTEHYKAAKQVWELHDESQQQLMDLTADIDLSGFSLPPKPDTPANNTTREPKRTPCPFKTSM